MMFHTIVFVLSCSVVTFAAPKGSSDMPTSLPEYVKPCMANDTNLNNCAQRNGDAAIPLLVKGERKYNIPILDPLNLPKADLKHNNDLTLNLEKITILGLKNTKLAQAKVDLKNNHIELTLSIPKLDLSAQYKMSGKIGVIPLNGQGEMETTLTGLTLTYALNYEPEVRKDGKKYISKLKPSISFKVTKAHYQFDNIVNGNKQLSDETNKLLNMNEQEVITVFAGPIVEIIKEVSTHVTGSILSNISTDKIFT